MVLNKRPENFIFKEKSSKIFNNEDDLSSSTNINSKDNTNINENDLNLFNKDDIKPNLSGKEDKKFSDSDVFDIKTQFSEIQSSISKIQSTIKEIANPEKNLRLKESIENGSNGLKTDLKEFQSYVNKEINGVKKNMQEIIEGQKNILNGMQDLTQNQKSLLKFLQTTKENNNKMKIQENARILEKAKESEVKQKEIKVSKTKSDEVDYKTKLMELFARIKKEMTEN